MCHYGDHAQQYGNEFAADFREEDFYIENCWYKHVIIGDIANNVSHFSHATAVMNTIEESPSGYHYDLTICRKAQYPRRDDTCL